MRVLTDKHVRGDLTLKTTAFSLSDLQTDGFSLIRWLHIPIANFTVIADNIRLRGKAANVVGALLGRAETLRSYSNDDGSRSFCVVDDPVVNQPGLVDNPAHAIAVSSVAIDKNQAKELRDLLLSSFERANYINDLC